MIKDLTFLCKVCWPTFAGLFLILMNMAPISFFGLYETPIPFILPFIFYFAVFHPNALNIICIFILGLFADLILSDPFGVNTFAYVLLFFAANINRRYFFTLEAQGLWLAFCALLALTFVVLYILVSLATLSFLPIIPIMFQFVVLSLLYPLVFWVLAQLNLKIGDAS